MRQPLYARTARENILHAIVSSPLFCDVLIATCLQAAVVTAGHSTMAEHNQRPAGLLQEPTGCACPQKN
jgi:hypothetical protein